MFGFGKQKIKQDVCILPETNSVKDDQLEAGTLHADNIDTAEAWGLDSGQQCKDEKTGRYIQFISSISCTPIQIYFDHGFSRVRKIKTADISSQTEDQEMTFTDRGRSKDGRLLWLGISLAMLTLMVCIVVLLKMTGG